MKIYYDMFNQEFCVPDKRTLDYAPPERFVSVYCDRGDIDGIFKEIWVVGDCKLLSIAFSRDEYYDKKLRYFKQLAVESEKNVNLLYMESMYIPESEYNQIVEELQRDSL